MLFTYLLASALAMSAVLGRSTDPTSRQMTYVDEDQTVTQSEDTAQVVAVDDRSSNLKYVMAIQSSTIWEEIKKRSLTISASQGLNDAVIEKSLDNLTDQELAQLKQACEDGLKCVAVDHLLMLKQVSEPLGGGKVSVRTAITKITQVVTQYTTEYHEDVYQYEAVQQSDDQYQVYKSVTTILEDNKELCQIDLTPATEQSQNGDGNTTPAAVNNNSTVNYNTFENYNINNGTINSATINKQPSDITTVVESPEPGTQDNNGSDSNLVIVIAPQTKTADGDGFTKNESVSKAPKNDVSQRRSRQGSQRTSDPHYEPGTTAGRSSPYDGVGSDYVSATDTDANKRDTGHSGHVENNNVTLKNEGENGQTSKSKNDIVNAGSGNHGDLRKGYVEDGALNNGNMVQYNINNGTINKGKISGSNADNGIISVGTVNNGPVNYDASNTYVNNGKQIAMNNYDVQQYLSNIDKMYSTILARLG